MEIGFAGMGRMGYEMAGRLVDGGHTVFGYDISSSALEKAALRGIITVESLEKLGSCLQKPRVVWLQAPPGEGTDTLVQGLEELLEPGDTIVDGGNSDFRNSVRWGNRLREKGITFVDCGVSGGVQGAREGCGLLVGAAPEVFEQLLPVFQSLAAPGGCRRVGGAGAGHFAKMVHNGVEYALMEAYAEGYELLQASELDVDIIETMQAWQGGCSIRSLLLEKMIQALKPDVALEDVNGYVADSGMGRWTLEEGIRLKVPMPAIAVSLLARFRSQQPDSPAMKSLAALRGVIGGHPVQRKCGQV